MQKREIAGRLESLEKFRLCERFCNVKAALPDSLKTNASFARKLSEVFEARPAKRQL